MGEPDHIALAAEVARLAAAGVMTPNELRAQLAMEPLETDPAQAAQYYPAPKDHQHDQTKTHRQTRSHSRSMDHVLHAAVRNCMRR